MVWFSLIGCNSQHVRLLKKGQVKETNYVKVIPIQYEKGLLFLPVEIAGQTYNFIFDTGADATVIDQRIARAIDYKKRYERNVNDSGKRRRKLEYIEIPSIKIGDINFQKTGAIISDLSIINEVLGCYNIHGIIGSNLMRKAKWQIDYAQERITVSDQIIRLKPNRNAYTYNMKSGKIGNGILRVNINGVASNFKIDTGFAGFIKAGPKVLSTILSNTNDFEIVTLNGITGAGLFGKNIGEKQFGYAENCSIGDLEMSGKVIEFRAKGNQLTGNYLFEHFRVTTDWDNELLYLEPTKTIKRDTLREYPVRIAGDYPNGAVYISSKWKEIAQDTSVEIGTKVIGINGQSITDFNEAELCQFLMDKSWKMEKMDVILEGGKRVSLQQQQILPKK